MNTLILSALTSLTLFSTPDRDWKVFSEQQDEKIETRAADDNGLWEVRLTRIENVTADKMAAALWNFSDIPQYSAQVKSVKLIQRAKNNATVYLQLEIPLMKGRDYTLKYKRAQPAAGTTRIDFRVANDLGPQENDAFVRLTQLYGYWQFEPAGENKTKVTYSMFCDPKVTAPTGIVNNEQAKATSTIVKALAKYATNNYTAAR